MTSFRNNAWWKNLLIYAPLSLLAWTALIMSLRSDTLTHSEVRRVTPLTLKGNSFEQHSPRNTHTKGLKGYHVIKNQTENCMLLFVCVVNLQGNFAQNTRIKRMIQQGVFSISKFYPGANVLISYGEVGTKPNLTLPASTRVQLEEITTKSFTEGGYTSFGRMEAYAEIINNELKKKTPRNIIFYDADMLFVGSHFRKVFEFKENWAVGLSFRNMQKFQLTVGLCW